MNEAEWLVCPEPGRMLRFATGFEDAADVPQGWKMPSDRKLRLFACACCRAMVGVGSLAGCPALVNALAVAESYADGEVGDGARSDAFEEAMREVGWATVPESPARVRAIAVRNTLVANAELAGQIGRDLAAMAATQERPLTVNGVWAALLREVCGNPWRRVVLPVRHREGCDADPDSPERAYSSCRCPCPYLTPQALDLAAAAYRERGADGALDHFRLAVLADALEEASCTDETMLRHLRGWERCGGCERLGLLPLPRLRQAYVPCPHCDRTGWVRKAAPCVRGCWATDLLTGRG